MAFQDKITSHASPVGHNLKKSPTFVPDVDVM
jgi:hypothetical protein